MQIVAPETEISCKNRLQEKYVQKEAKPRKYGSANEIHVRMNNIQIIVSEKVSSKGKFKFTNSI